MLEEIFSFDHLYLAYKKCRNSKQHKGEVIRFEVNLAVNLYSLNKALVTKKYKLGNYKKFFIYEPKQRLIEAYPFKDRVVIRCFCDIVLKPKIEKKLIFDNCACRIEKGTHFAIERLHKFMKKEFFKYNNNYIYFLKCDIRKYFASIDHDILLKLLNDIDFTEDEKWLIKILINNKNEGLPLGSQSNQWFALFYLNKVDHFIKEKLNIKYYVRYMDDFILISRDKKYLVYCKNVIEEMCLKLLKLELNKKTQIGRLSNGVDFLGFRHILTPKGKIVVKLRSSSKQRIKKHLKTVNKLYIKGIVDEDYVKQRLNSFYNHVKNTNEKKNFKNFTISLKDD